MFSGHERMQMVDVGKRVPQERSGRDPVLSAILLDATFSSTVSLEFNPPRIDLGYLGREAAWLQKRSRLKEHGKAVWAYVDQHLYLSSEIVGDGHSNTVHYYYHYHPQYPSRKDREQYHLATYMHGHPVSLPPSPIDVSLLFLEEYVINAAPAIIVTTPLEKIVIFRSPSTPTYGEYEVSRRICDWKNEVML